MSTRKTLVILTVAMMMSFTLAAPAFAKDISGIHTIDADYAGVVGTTYTDSDTRIAPGGGSSGTIVITDGYTFETSGEMRFGENGIYAEITVEVGGHLQAEVEALFNEGEISNMSTRLNVFGTAYIEQIKCAQAGNDNEVVVGTVGGAAATLTIVEGYLGKNGMASMTINDNSSFIIDGDWAGSFKIDTNGTTGAYIDLVGSGTIRALNSGAFTGSAANSIIGNGGTTAVTTAVDGAYTVYSTPEPATMSLLAIGGLALLRRKRRRA
jgi:hypothetical protein